MEQDQSKPALLAEIDTLKYQLEEATDTLEAIRTGQIDALVVTAADGHALYTLKSADHAYRIFVEQMTEGAVTLNSTGLIQFSNSQFAAMVKAPLTKVLGYPLMNFIADVDQPLFEELLRRSWHEVVKHELSLRCDPLPIPVLLSLNVLQLDGEATLSVIITDLTQQKKTEKELTSKNKQLELLNEALVSSNHDLQQFASVASHDLQEPLRKIQVFANFLKERSIDVLPNASKQYVEKIIGASNRMKTLIVDILTYSRLSANDSDIGPVALPELIEEILEDLDLKILEKNATIDLSELPTIDGNKGQLRQVFYNLLSNALKFNSPGNAPHIIIRTRPVRAKELGVSLLNEEQYCRISIQDNGIGFDEKFAASIFSLFEKLHHKSTFEGSGIGLAIAKKIIDKHHGLIIAKSVIGQGSEFNIILPLRHITQR
jgi:signal transduction histidine kinase